MCVFHRLLLFERAAGVVGGNRVWRLAGGSLRRLRMVSTQAGELHIHTYWKITFYDDPVHAFCLDNAAALLYCTD